MKRILSLSLVLLLLTAVLFSGIAGCSFAEEPDETLVIYNWGDYIDEDIEEEFEEYYESVTGKKLDIVYSTFETNEIMLTTVEKGEEVIDLVCPSEYAIQKLMEGGYLQKLDYSKISTYQNVESDIYDKVNEVFTHINVPGVGEDESMADYFVPYMWGTLGILYNADVVTPFVLLIDKANIFGESFFLSSACSSSVILLIIGALFFSAISSIADFESFNIFLLPSHYFKYP